ncbi:hypothetical protein ACI3PL_32140, partial [Lacticaseibacillus paracasei]
EGKTPSAPAGGALPRLIREGEKTFDGRLATDAAVTRMNEELGRTPQAMQQALRSDLKDLQKNGKDDTLVRKQLEWVR